MDLYSTALAFNCIVIGDRLDITNITYMVAYGTIVQDLRHRDGNMTMSVNPDPDGRLSISCKSCFWSFSPPLAPTATDFHLTATRGSQGSVSFLLALRDTSYPMTIEYMCNNQQNNSVTVIAPNNFAVTSTPGPEVLRTATRISV